MTNPIKRTVKLQTFHKVMRALEHMHSLMRLHAWVSKLGLVRSRRVTCNWLSSQGCIRLMAF